MTTTVKGSKFTRVYDFDNLKLTTYENGRRYSSEKFKDINLMKENCKKHIEHNIKMGISYIVIEN